MIISKQVETPGWDAGGRTIESMSGDGALRFSTGQTTGIVCGLSHADETPHYREIDFAFFLEPRTYRIIERGVEKTAPAPRSVGAVYRIERIAGRVQYYVDNARVYTSAVQSFGEVFGDCSLYAYGDAILDVDLTPVDRTGGVLGIGPLVARGSDDADVAFGALGSRFDVVGAMRAVAEGTLALSALSMRGADAPVAYGALRLGRLAVRGSDVADLRPDYASGRIGLGYVQMRASDAQPLLSEGALALGPLATRGADAPVAYGQLGLGRFSLAGYSLPRATVYAEWPRWQADIRQVAAGSSTAVVYGEMPALEGRIVTYRVRVEAQALLPVLEGFALAGAVADAELPGLEGLAAAIAIGSAMVLGDLPALEGDAVALAGALATASASLPALEGLARTGAVAGIDFDALLPALIGSAAAITGHMATSELVLPALTGAVAATAVPLATFELLLPALEGWAGPGVSVAGDLPPLVGFISVQGDAPEHETYVVTLGTNAVTQWRAGRIDKAASAADGVFFLRDGRVYRVAGEDDDGVPVAMRVRFAPTDFGSPQLKRADTIYFHCRERNGMRLSLVPDERVIERYGTAPDRQRGIGAHKVNVGRGVQFHTLGLVVENVAGERLEIGRIDLLVTELSRKPR